MKQPIKEMTLEEYHRLTAAHPRKRTPRPDIPRAPQAEPVGLDALLKRGWSLASDDRTWRLYKINQDAMDTGPCADLATACRRAKELER